MKVYICYKCSFATSIKDRFDNCPVCGNDFIELNQKDSKAFLNLSIDNRTKWVEEKTNTIISDELKQKKAEYISNYLNEKKINESNQKIEAAKSYAQSQSNIPKCPTCGSTNITKIGTFNRMISTGFFGLASGKIGKTMKCKNCGYTF